VRAVFGIAERTYQTYNRIRKWACVAAVAQGGDDDVPAVGEVEDKLELVGLAEVYADDKEWEALVRAMRSHWESDNASQVESLIRTQV
jgi:hypothetical protein